MCRGTKTSLTLSVNTNEVTIYLERSGTHETEWRGVGAVCNTRSAAKGAGAIVAC